MVTKARKGLGDLLKTEVSRINPEVTELQITKDTDPQTNKPTDLRSQEVPKYLRLIRKETRISAEQYQELTVLARQLSRASTGKGERITENTLIRIAVEILLSRKDRLQGTTEEELLESVLKGNLRR